MVAAAPQVFRPELHPLSLVGSLPTSNGRVLRFSIPLGVLRVVETSVSSAFCDDRECSGEPQVDLCESLELSIVRIGLETYTVVTRGENEMANRPLYVVGL